MAMSRAMEGRSFDSMDEANAFVQSAAVQQAIAAAAKASDLWGQAQEVAYDAWETKDFKRYALARQALEIDPRCSDAWLILAEEERTWRKQRRLFERAVAAADMACVEERWLVDEEDQPRDLYRYLPGRSYLRAYMAFARFLMDGGYSREARAVYEKMLERDPEDHMGARYEVVQLYHQPEDRGALRALLERYAEDATCLPAYERLWLSLVEDEEEGVVQQADQAAREANPHVLGYLTGEASVPKNLPDQITMGGKDEAVSYFAMSFTWWLDNPKTKAWVMKQQQGPATGAGEAKGPGRA
ncbi:MAG: hypothetical protein M1602_06620 [Firmicutes bacterium]|nr:hypothetical protein [Bacillota bacterium]